MSNTFRPNAMPPGGVRAFFSSRLWPLVLALTLAPVYAATPGAPGAVKGQLRMASLQLEVWPEYDRPAALVIIRGELATDVALPAVISLRIAAASGGPTAVAYSTTAGGNLLNLQFNKADAGNFITLKFTVPERFFHVEFYDPLKSLPLKGTFEKHPFKPSRARWRRKCRVVRRGYATGALRSKTSLRTRCSALGSRRSLLEPGLVARTVGTSLRIIGWRRRNGQRDLAQRILQRVLKMRRAAAVIFERPGQNAFLAEVGILEVAGPGHERDIALHQRA